MEIDSGSIIHCDVFFNGAEIENRFHGKTVDNATSHTVSTTASVMAIFKVITQVTCMCMLYASSRHKCFAYSTQ
eukprot:scaffold474047_cov26-Prasinocladus_malaysianus.AAC.2